MNEYIDSVKAWWEETADSAWYQSLRTEDAVQQVLQNPESAFAPQVYALLQKRMHSFAGKKVLIPSAGDCHAAFALAVLGAQVTASDISQRQLMHARRIAETYGLQMDFVQADTMTLAPFEGDAFDLVYTSNGVHSWIDEPDKMYANIARVLKSGGLSVMWDIHPFQRPFSGERFAAPELIKAYDDVAPRQHNHWRVMDLVNAMAKSGLYIEEMLEISGEESYFFSYGEEKDERAADWHHNPMAALPTHISLAARKG